jgi:hypothetical protein
MSFKINKVAGLSEVTHDLFNSMINNDNLVKSYVQSISPGVLGYKEGTSSVFISSLDSEDASDSDADTQEDPDWQNLLSITFLAKKFHVIKFTIIGSSITHVSTSNISTKFVHGANMRISTSYLDEPDPSNASAVPYRHVTSGGRISSNVSLEFGRMFGSQLCVAYDQPGSATASFFKNLPLIQSGVVTASLDIKKLQTPQRINCSSEEKLQFFVEDMGIYR